MLALLLSLLLMVRNRILDVHPFVTAALLLAGFLAIDPRITPRPEMFTFLFLTALLLILDLYALHNRNILYIVPLIMLLWCNMHALFILGLIVLVTFCISRLVHDKKTDRTLLVYTGISFAVCLLNPYGIKGFTFPFELLTRFDSGNVYNRHIQEFMPFLRQESYALHDWLFLALILSAVIGTAFTLKRRQLHEVVLMVLFAFLAFASIRNIPLFVLTALPLLGREASEVGSGKGKIPFWLNRVLFSLLILLPAVLAPRLITNAHYLSNRSFNKTGTGIDPEQQPVSAAAFVTKHYPGKRILNSIGFGGWLSWAQPEPVFIDGRLEVMQESLYGEVIASWNGGLPELVGKYRPGVIIYNYVKYYPWTLQLRSMQNWRLVYLDGLAAVFTPDSNNAAVPTLALSSLPPDETPGARESSLSWLEGFYRPVDYAVMDQRHRSMFRSQMNPETPGQERTQQAVAFFNDANRLYRQGDVRGALAAYDSAVALNPSYAKAFNNRGILRASALKDLKGAIADFSQAIGIDPGYGDAYLGRGTALFFLNDTEKACSDWKQAMSLGNRQAARLLELHCNGK
jgi:hypothetical protein